MKEKSDDGEPFSALGSLGIVGLVIALAIWIVATIITGYFLGIGIWAATPRSIMRVLEDKVEERSEKHRQQRELALEWREAVYSAIDSRIGSKRLAKEGGGHYEDVNFIVVTDYGDVTPGEVRFIVALTGRNAQRVAKRDAMFDWPRNNDAEKIGKVADVLVGLYEELKREEQSL